MPASRDPGRLAPAPVPQSPPPPPLRRRAAAWPRRMRALPVAPAALCPDPVCRSAPPTSRRDRPDPRPPGPAGHLTPRPVCLAPSAPHRPPRTVPPAPRPAAVFVRCAPRACRLSPRRRRDRLRQGRGDQIAEGFCYSTRGVIRGRPPPRRGGGMSAVWNTRLCRVARGGMQPDAPRPRRDPCEERRRAPRRGERERWVTPPGRESRKAGWRHGNRVGVQRGPEAPRDGRAVSKGALFGQTFS